MAKKLFIRTFGCQMNEYDSDKMADVLAAAEEIVKTDTPDDADIILFNTCSVREKAQERVFHDLGRVRLLKLARPDLVIGVGGCVASQEGAAIVARAPYVDVVFGPQTLHRLPQLIADRRRLGKSQVDISFRKSRSSTICRRRESKAPPPLSRSWRAAASSAPSASFPTRAAKRCRVPSTTS
jgi:tRNA-2-methylthio-N6-dimethylallyladenosine synthase